MTLGLELSDTTEVPLCFETSPLSTFVSVSSRKAKGITRTSSSPLLLSSLELIDAQVCEPWIRTRLGTTARFRNVVVLGCFMTHIINPLSHAPCLLRRWQSYLAHTVFSKSFCKSQLPHESVKSLFISVIVEDTLTDFGSVVFCKATQKHRYDQSLVLPPAYTRTG